jgi:hypothetical protein
MIDANVPANTINAQIPPMPFGFTLERVYRILRNHLKVFLGIAAPPAVAMILLYAVLFGVIFTNMRPLLSTSNSPIAAATAQLKMMRIMFPSMMLAMIPLTVVIAFYLAAAFHAGNRIDSGIGTSVRECFGQAWSRLGRSLGLLLWIYFRAFGPLLALEVVWFGLLLWFGLDGSHQNPPTSAFLILPLIWLLLMAASVYGTIVALRMSLAFPASIDEGLTAGEAIRRSSTLTRGSRGRIFLLLLVVELIGCAAIFILEIVAGIIALVGAVGAAALHLQLTSPWSFAGMGVVGLIFACLFYVWIALLYASLVVALSVVYHDQRRREAASLPPPVARCQG